MEVLFTADSNGMIRYIDMDGDNMYFKAKHFPQNDLRLCAVEKETELWINTVNMRGFHITNKIVDI